MNDIKRRSNVKTTLCENRIWCFSIFFLGLAAGQGLLEQNSFIENVYWPWISTAFSVKHILVFKKIVLPFIFRRSGNWLRSWTNRTKNQMPSQLFSLLRSRARLLIMVIFTSILFVKSFLFTNRASLFDSSVISLGSNRTRTHISSDSLSTSTIIDCTRQVYSHLIVQCLI